MSTVDRLLDLAAERGFTKSYRQTCLRRAWRLPKSKVQTIRCLYLTITSIR